MALGRDPRMIREEDRSGEQRGVVVAHEHGPGVDVLAAVRLERRDEAATRRPEHAMRRHERARKRLGPGEPVGNVCRFSHRQSRTRAAVTRLGLGGEDGTPRSPSASNAAHPVRPGGSAALRRPVALAGRLPEDAPPRSSPRVRPAQQALDLEVVEGRAARGRVRGRIDDSERGRGRVLRRARRVRVKRIALVEERPTSSSRPSGHCAASRAGRRRSSRTTACPTRRNAACRRPSVSTCKRIQPLRGVVVVDHFAPDLHRHPERRGECAAAPGRSAADRRRPCRRSSPRRRSRSGTCAARRVSRST